MPGVYLQCDHPGCSIGISSPGDKFGIAALHRARREGWLVAERHERGTLNNGPDYCPKHRPDWADD